jgi:glycosyltransferase involved in cell wall biosynthesis
MPWEATRGPRPAVLAETRRLLRIVEAYDPDLVHLHSSKAGLAGRLALRGRRPTIFQPHGWSFEAVTGLAQAGAVGWERLAARWTSALVCVSNGERRRGEEVGISARWRVVPNGVDLERFPAASEEDRQAARRGLGLDGGPLALCVGRLTRQKGQDVLLDAWPTVRQRVPGATLLLVGEGPDQDDLERRQVPGVVFAGQRRDVAEWLAATDLVVLPSRWEGMAFTMLEAMARGRSVVMTSVSGAREAIAGGAGAVVPPEDGQALAEAIALRLSDRTLAAAEGAEGRRRAEERYDMRLGAAALTAIYRDLLE